MSNSPQRLTPHDLIPMPSRSIAARWILPFVIIAAAGTALAVSAFEAARPAIPVRVAPVVALARMSEAAGAAPAGQSGADRAHGERTAAAPIGSAAAAPVPAARWVQAPGWVEPDPQPVVVSALRDGIVEEVLVLEGDRVDRGGAVARLESRTAQLALARAKAELARAEAERERRLAMAEAARTEEAQLPFERAAAQARYDAARDASERADKLAAANAMGESEVVRMRNAMLEAHAELEAIEPRQRAIAAAIRAADAEANTVALVPKAVVDDASLHFERSTVSSPIDGVVLEVLATPGQSLFAGDMALGRAVVTLYDPRKLRVRADVPLADAAGLAIGQRAKVTVEVLPDRVFDGLVSRLVHKADIQKNTVGVKVTIVDPSSELKPDMLAKVRIEIAGVGGPPEPRPRAAADENRADAGDVDRGPLTAAAHTTLLVRSDALSGEGPDRRVFVVTGIDRGRGRIESRRVRVGDPPLRDGWLPAIDGLAAGDRVVVDPPDDLESGAVVVITETLHDPTEVAHGAR